MSEENGRKNDNIIDKTELSADVASSDMTEKGSAQEKSLGISMLARVAIGVVVVVSLVISVTSMMRYNRLEEEKRELEAQLAAKNEEIEEMKHLLDSPLDADYIIKIARERLGLYFPDEVVYYININD